MDFIWTEKSQVGYNSKTGHCLNGSDADHMMLGLLNVEPKASLINNIYIYIKDLDRAEGECNN